MTSSVKRFCTIPCSVTASLSPCRSITMLCTSPPTLKKNTTNDVTISNRWKLLSVICDNQNGIKVNSSPSQYRIGPLLILDLVMKEWESLKPPRWESYKTLIPQNFESGFKTTCNFQNSGSIFCCKILPPPPKICHIWLENVSKFYMFAIMIKLRDSAGTKKELLFLPYNVPILCN